MFSLVRDPYEYRKKKDKRDIFKEKQMRSINRLDQRSAIFLYKEPDHKYFRLYVSQGL